MACFHPLKAFQRADGEVVFVEDRRCVRALDLPCGQCVGCRLERSRQWAVRCVHEASMHVDSSFVTLTYDDERLSSMSLVYRDFQLFMKRLRKAKGFFDVDLWHWCPRFYMAGEYGDQFKRPHFHALLFGCFFPDREFLRSMPSGARLYRSGELERLWPFGFSSVGDVTFESAAYVARYVMKKITGDAAAEAYEAVDGMTGEIVERLPEFNHMSLKPGIGALWFDRYRREVFERDYCVINGVKVQPPRAYKKRLAQVDLESAEFVAYGRSLRAEKFAEDGTPERLKVREAVSRARLSFKRRILE